MSVFVCDVYSSIVTRYTELAKFVLSALIFCRSAIFRSAFSTPAFSLPPPGPQRSLWVVVVYSLPVALCGRDISLARFKRLLKTLCVGLRHIVTVAFLRRVQIFLLTYCMWFAGGFGIHVREASGRQAAQAKASWDRDRHSAPRRHHAVTHASSSHRARPSHPGGMWVSTFPCSSARARVCVTLTLQLFSLVLTFRKQYSKVPRW